MNNDQPITKCPAYQHQHPTLVMSLQTRTGLLGTLNLAIALRGKSCGWGTCERPRRTFVGHYRSNRKENRKAGSHFITLSIDRDAMMRNIWECTIWGDRP